MTVRNERVLVTYGWCRTAYVVCERLALAGFKVSACGDSVLCMTRASRYVDTFDRIPDPFANPRLYAVAVGETARRRGAGLIVPVHEDFVPLQEFRDALPPGVIVAGPPQPQGCEVLDKANLVRIAEEAGIPAPRTFAPGSIEEAEQILRSIALPVVLKPRRGNGGKGVIVVRDAAQGAADYAHVVERFGLEAGGLPLIQEHISGDPMGACFLSVNGEMKACFVERYLRCKQAGIGTSVLREPVVDSGIEAYAARLCKELSWTGVGHLDFIVSEGTPYLLELNPRFWGALNLAVQNGFDFPAALAAFAITGAVDPRWFAPRPPVPSLWIAGELMACLDDLKSGRWKPALATPIRFLRCRRYDDFRLKDPLPLIFELAYYLTGFLRAGGDVNPARAAMMSLKTGSGVTQKQRRPLPMVAAPYRGSATEPRPKGAVTFYTRTGKRLLDLCLSVGALILLALPMAAVALAILFTSGRPVLFAQERIGRSGRRFRILKFRTMAPGAEAGGPVTVAGDPRVTPIGRLLRRWKLDEFPQVWNVMRGDMSLVGPRADVPGFADLLRGADRVVLGVRPGLTGPATLVYRNEEKLLADQPDPGRYNAEVLFPDKVRINKAYVERLCLREDMRCLIATVAAVAGSEK
jgi:lipopolysaccharide/colanic/teichoic acid biosynthesis glycosyltransferase